ncbi:hypothetical protein [Flavobacterium sp. GT3R68]|uniref:hypothetical protein n=1 Tax=Flavobacterium sp. GT3R68 TaxID=2594437 RepID=UPI000F8875AB|nr:hypothetical protein [Flavobacterium sp. GT3R68]RTY92444.1 hypothetical protein EKL32_16700 [Flavobacterium sp. GSN2]TRW94069.1 hypothetical protein FNW07_03915 [Flavobacterium sp. GT3R68]
MNKIDLLYGFLIGIIATVLGSYLFLAMFTDYGFIEGIQIMKSRNQLGKIITLGAILNLAMFFILLKVNRELMARGVILALIILTIITLFV